MSTDSQQSDEAEQLEDVEGEGVGEVTTRAQARARAPPEPDSPPRGASRGLGGSCPECNGPMHSRLRAEYDGGRRYTSQIKLVGVCDDCDLFLEGKTPAIRLLERDI